MKLKDFLAPIFVLLISSLLIFFRFNQIPLQLAFDEIEFAKIALSLENQPYTPYVTTAYGHSTPYFYVILAFFKMFGVNGVALRLPSAISALIAGVLFFYLLKKLSKSYLLAYIGSFVLITQRWFYNFARFSFEATFLLMLELASVLFLITFFESKHKIRYVYMIGASLFSGLAFLSYYPGRIFFLLPLTILLMRRNLNHVGFFLAGFLLVISPLLFYYRSQPDIRISQLLIVSSTKLNILQKTMEISENIKRNVLHLYLNQGDMNGRHNYPGKAAVNPVIALFMTLGLIEGVRGRRKIINQIFLLFFLISIIPAILVYSSENPNMLRSFTSLVPIAYFTALGCVWLLNKFPLKKYVVLVGLVALLLLAALYDIRTYFIFQKEVFKQSFEVFCPLPQVLAYHPKTLPEIPWICRTHSPKEELQNPL